MRIRTLVWLTLICLLTGCSPASTPPYQWQLPAGFPVPDVPVDNPMSEAKVALGRALFYDVNLSFNQSIACASCHIQAFAFAEPKQKSVGASKQVLRRNALALVNVAYNGSFTWAHNGLTQIEQQLLIPMFTESPPEMGITGFEAAVLARFNSEDYRSMFRAAFDDAEPSYDHMVKALASFVRSLLSFNSPFDRYAYQGIDGAMSKQAIRGMNLFFSERLECFHCHGGFNFTQSSKHGAQPLDLKPFHNIGLFDLDGKGAYPAEDKGLIEISLEHRDMGRFRAPTLRNVEKSAPYMHDGSLASLEEVIDFYAAGGRGEGVTSPLKSQFVQGFQLTDGEKQALLAFLRSLTDESFLSNPEFAAPE